MATGEQVRQAIYNVIKSALAQSALRPAITCKVIGVSADIVNDTFTCDCAPIDNTSVISDVKLIADNNHYGFILVPTVGSIVKVSFNSDSDGFISMVSQVDKIYLNGNDYGGLVEVQPLITKLNNLENTLNKIITALNTWTPVPNDGGAALKALISAALITNLIPTQKVDLENTTVEHGKGNFN